MGYFQILGRKEVEFHYNVNIILQIASLRPLLLSPLTLASADFVN